ncbi:hypothetical protein MIND_01230200 [Mycena indigotica]|uniref:Spore coat protein U domain-containing protein n=1 Tax=Mycena indigotica TaxID=2126181 RepID=A0A8H6S3F7_9AGAR|nr:uncharacterized protein MIND_01230200 [Mycena indigotica]KAF7292041.1 hypothetical protein MIND_01230200 [Mycena indigotica]
MHFSTTALFTALFAATSALAQTGFCPEAARFGGVKISPSTLSPGETFTVMANLTCAVQLGNTPTFLDYYVDGTATHAISGPVLIARRTYNGTAAAPVDIFPVKLPEWFYFTDATYAFRMVNSFARAGPTGESVITSGSISVAMNITGI